MKMKDKDLFWFSFYSLFSAWKIAGNLPSTEQAVKTKPKQDVFFFHHF